MKLKLRIVTILLLCLFTAISFAIYFSFTHMDPQSPEKLQFAQPRLAVRNFQVTSDGEYYKNLSIKSVAAVAGIKINRKLQSLNFTIAEKTAQFAEVLKWAKGAVDFSVLMKVSPWDLAASWVKPHQVHKEKTPELGYVLHALSKGKIIHAGIGYKGTQLKIMLKLDGGQEVIYKPMRYERDYIVTGSPYSGADRHNGEIASFHLNRLLGLCRCPLTVGRSVNLRTEVQPVASESLSKTFFTKENNTCFYGHCYYCSPSDPACAKGDTIEGAVILMLPEKYRLKRYRSPWQRTYKNTITARWEQDFSYCDQIRKIDLYKKGRRLPDLIDAAVFDYLIGNADRHHYEVFADFPESAVILLDNGKSFGNPYWDELTILAPLYQCCRIRKSVFERLWMLVGHLGQSLRELLSFDHLAPVLTEAHFEALDRRLRTVLATIEVCFDEFGEDTVLIDDT